MIALLILALLTGTPPKKATLERCEKQAVPSSYLLGDQLLHRMQVKRCLDATGVRR